MSTDNIENTKPINKQIGDTQPAEVPAIDRTDLPVDSQAETRVIRKRAAKKQAGGDVSTAETIRITPPLDQPEEMNESPASVDEQAAEEPALASPDVPAEETAKQLPELLTAGSDVPTPPPPGDEPLEPAVKVKRGKWIWLGILIMLVMILAGSGIGWEFAL